MAKTLTAAQRRQLNREAWALLGAMKWESPEDRQAAFEHERQRLYALVLAGCEPASSRGVPE